MSANEKKLADFILDNASLIRDYSSQQIAAAVGVSQSSIVKFSQKLGYQGFPDLKLAIHEAVLLGAGPGVGGPQQTSNRESTQSARERLFQVKTEALRNTMELNEENRLMAAVEVLERSERIQIIALGAGSMVARNFASMLIQIGRTITMNRILGTNMNSKNFIRPMLF